MNRSAVEASQVPRSWWAKQRQLVALPTVTLPFDESGAAFSATDVTHITSKINAGHKSQIWCVTGRCGLSVTLSLRILL